MGKRVLGMVLAIALVFTSVDMTVFAKTEDSVTGGEQCSPSPAMTEEPEELPESPTPEATTEITPEATPEITPEEIPEATPEITSEETPEATPEATPDVQEGQLPFDTTESAMGDSTPDSSLETASTDIAGGTITNAIGTVNWSIDESGKLTVSGKGEVNVDKAKSLPWKSYKTQITSAVIELSETEDMSYLLSDCVNLYEVDISGSDTGKTKNMYGMFKNCNNLVKITGEFKTSNVTSMAQMFYMCKKLKTLDVSGFDTGNVLDVHDMFHGCNSLTSLDVSNFKTDKIKNMSAMFWGCSLLESLDVSSFNTEQVTDMSYMFSDLEKVQKLDLRNFRTSKVTNMRCMFAWCNALTEVNLSNFDTSEVTDMAGMFKYCYHMTEWNIDHFVTSKVTDMSEMFTKNWALEKLDLSHFDTSSLEAMDWMFYECKALTELNLTGFDTSEIKSMEWVFAGCTSLSELDLSSFDTSQVMSMYNMFERTGLNKLDLSNFDTSKVTDMKFMFANSVWLKELNISSFDTSSLREIDDMFYGCKRLQALDLGKFDLHLVLSGTNLLDGCTSLVRINAPVLLPSDIIVTLPGLAEDKWYLADGSVVTQLPTEQEKSLVLQKNEIPDTGDILKKGIEINGRGIAYATFPLKDNDGILLNNKAVRYSFDGKTVYQTESDENGLVTIETPVFENTTGTGEEHTLTAELTIDNEDGSEQTLDYSVIIKITVYPLSFTQKWELSGEELTQDDLGAARSVLTEAETDSTMAGKLSIVSEYDKGSRSLTFLQTYENKIAERSVMGPASAAPSSGSGMDFDVTSESASAQIGQFTGIGITINDYDENDQADLQKAGKFLTAVQAQATGNMMLLMISDRLGYEEDQLSVTGTGIALAQGTESVDFGGKKAGEVTADAAETVHTYAQSADNATGLTNRKYEAFSGGSESFVIEAEADLENWLQKLYITLPGGEDSDIRQITYEGQEADILYQNSQVAKSFADANVHYILNTARDQLLSELDAIAAGGSYQESKFSQEITDVDLEVGQSLGFGLDAGRKLEGISSYEYETARGVVKEGETEISSTSSDIDDLVKDETVTLSQLMEEPAKAAGESILSCLDDRQGQAQEGISNNYASIKGNASDVSVHLVSLKESGTDEDVQSLLSYELAAYPSSQTMGADRNTAQTVYSVGNPYYVYFTDASGKEIYPASEDAFTLELSYTDEMLAAAGISADSANDLAVYQYSESTYGYVCLGGKADSARKSVTVTVTSPGQYVLAADDDAPMITGFAVSNASATPVITIAWKEAVDFGSFSMKIDDMECIDTQSWVNYYDRNRRLIIYPVQAALTEGEHVVTIYAKDSAGNAMREPAVYQFVVDTTAPILTEVKLALSSNELRIRAWSEDSDVETVKAFVCQKLRDESMIESECTLDVMEGYYTGIVSVRENLSEVTVSVTAWDKQGNRSETKTVTEAGENPQENVENDLWVRFLDGEGVDRSEYTYTGQAIKPEIELYEGTTLLAEKKDYTVSYRNNINAGNTASITVTGKGNYKGTETVTFTIHPKDISNEDDDSIVIQELAAVANGKEQKPVPVITYNKKKLSNKNDKDFKVTYPDTREGAYVAASADGYTIHVEGMGNYTGERDLAFQIGGKQTKKLTVTGVKNRDYEGGEITFPELEVKDGKTTLTENVHYTVSYLNNVDAGTASVVITGIAPEYVGTKTVNFKINGIPLKKAVIEKETLPKSVIYDGEAHCPELKLTYKKDKNSDAELLAESDDYEVEYSRNVNAGTAEILITGKNRFSGTIKKTFKILPYDAKTDQDKLLTVQEGITVAYAKGGAKAKPVVKFQNRVLTEGIDYTLSYKDNKAVTTENTKKQPTVTVKFKGNFKNSMQTTFVIMPQSLRNLSATADDRVYSAKKNAWKASMLIIDKDGKKLSAGQDYEKNLNYYLDEKCTVKAEADSYNQGTTIWVEATGKGNYAGSRVVTSYDIKAASIAKAKVKIKDQTYTGREIEIGYDDITSMRVGQDDLKAEDGYVIVPGSYKNNIRKGTATVQLKGIGNYGGTITVKFKIGQKWFLWRILD